MTTPQQRLDGAKKKAAESLQPLEKALFWLNANPQAEDRWVGLDAVAKRFEVAFEFVWKALRAAVDVKGDEVYGPKDAIAFAAKYRWVQDPEEWAEYLETRNAGVHDYFGLTEEEYAAVAARFHAEASRVLKALP